MNATKRLFPLLVLLSVTTLVSAASAERYLHVRVMGRNHESVRVNLPLSFAIKVIPAIDHGKLHAGRIEFGRFDHNGIDLRVILDAMKTAPEGEFVTVQETGNDVRVAKEHGQLVVHVVDKKGNKRDNVDVTVPWEVAEALTSGTNENELNLEAALRALEKAGDVSLVTVTSDEESVRVWIDSSSTSD